MTTTVTFTPEEAAAYLNISVKNLAEHVKRGDIRMHWHKRRKYHLAGEVDMLKSMITNTKHQMTKNKAKETSYCSPFRD